MISERRCHGWRRMRSSENEVVGRRGASGDGAHLVGGGRDLRRQLLTQLELLGDNPQINGDLLTIMSKQFYIC